MPMANITVRIDDAELRKAIDRVIDHMADLTPAMQEIGDYMITATRSRFDTETAPDGSKWAALSPRYAARKARMRSVVDGGKRILAKRGTLRDTIRYKASRSDVVIGSNEVYAAIHQLGGQAGRGRKATIPARPFLGISPQDQEEILRILGDYIT
jgi:phage virion morphogenesis protein